MSDLGRKRTLEISASRPEAHQKLDCATPRLRLKASAGKPAASVPILDSSWLARRSSRRSGQARQDADYTRLQLACQAKLQNERRLVGPEGLEPPT